jgi:trehalose transport system substrate-binding protein
MSTPPTTGSPAPPAPTTGQTYGRRAARTSAIWAIIVIVVAVAAGLGGYYYGHSTTTSSSTTTVTYYDDLSSSEEVFMTNTLIPAFEAQYPNIHINYVNIDANDMVTKIAALVSANDVGTTLIAEDNLDIGELLYASGGGNDLMNITALAPYMEPAQLIPSMVGVVNYETQTYGGIYFIPFRANVQLVWLNKTALADAGISTAQGPQNYTQLYDDAVTLGTNSVMIQGGAPPDTATQLFQWDVQFGGNPMVFDDPGDLAAMSYAYNLSAYMNPGYTSATYATYSGLAQGSYSMLVDQWPYVYPLLTGANSSITHPLSASTLLVYPGPNGTGAHAADTVVGGDVLAVPKGATNLWAIQLFAQFLLGEKAQQVLMVDTGNPAVNAAAYQNLPSNQSTVDLAIEAALENPVFRPPVPWITEWETLFYDDIFTPVVIQGHIADLTSDATSAYTQMESYLTSNFGATTASEYAAGDFGPLYV